MVRTLITPDKENISIKIPKSFIGKKVEVIAFTVEETLDDVQIKELTTTHLASEKSLSKDWLKPEEGIAWKNL
jgi:hypothetical protein